MSPAVDSAASTPAATAATTPATSSSALTPGSLVVVRDETWMVTAAEQTDDGTLVHTRGVSSLVADTSAAFYSSIDTITPLDPRAAHVVADPSSHYATARLWLEATLRRSPVPLATPGLTVADRALADQLPYQRKAVEKALDPAKLRPRILLADAVGLGKTLEIGMILAELIRRGRGDRILIVCPRHVLEQMQHEMWTRFAIPFVRLDSAGVQQVKQKLPATRNPFSYFTKVIVSIDTLKQDRFVHDLRRHRWDAVVIDESHNVTNQATQNNKLAHTLAPNTDALILASATPHNGKRESFAQLISLLDPTAITADGDVDEGAIGQLMVRRHRYSEEVASTVGDRWAERLPPVLDAVTPSPAEVAVGTEIARTWTHPASGAAPTTGKGSQLFPWTLAKAFLSSPRALDETVSARLHQLTSRGVTAGAEHDALARLKDLNAPSLATATNSAKYQRLVSLLREKGVAATSPERVVVFAERVPTLQWLQENLQRDLHLKPGQVEVMHGGLSDVRQQEIVESFKQAHSPIRVLVTGDVASEGVNLHAQCHELVHYDIPWSLIRIEQRNGRIDRYGQTTPPQITTLLLDLDVPGFSGDIRVLSRLMEREREAHEKLGDVASLMGKYDGDLEERALIDVLRGRADFEDVVPEVEVRQKQASSVVDMVFSGALDLDVFMAAQPAPQPAPSVFATLGEDQPEREPGTGISGLWGSDADYLEAGLTQIFERPDLSPAQGGVGYRRDGGFLSFRPDPDLQRRLLALPQSYLRDRHVLEELRLTTSPERAEGRLRAALSDPDGTTWPDVQFLGPLHPVLEWIGDRALARLGRNEVFAVAGSVEYPTVLGQATVTNGRGQTISTVLFSVVFPFGPANGVAEVFPGPKALFEAIGLGPKTPGITVPDPARFEPYIGPAIDTGAAYLKAIVGPVIEEERARSSELDQRLTTWKQRTEASGSQRELFRLARGRVEEDRAAVKERAEIHESVRALLVVVPPDAVGPRDAAASPDAALPPDAGGADTSTAHNSVQHVFDGQKGGE